MDLSYIKRISRKPPLYAKGDSNMWRDDHISKELLKIHLNPEIDLASRSVQSIDKTTAFVLGFCKKPGLRILDLGCGPGLYAERMAAAGHHVTGVDFSETSVEYASKQAGIKGMDIEYICSDYLTLDFTAQFDLVLMVYTDFGVLIPSDRDRLLTMVLRALKPGGIFIFDVINTKNLAEKFVENTSWNVESSGFWSNEPYLQLSSGFHFPENGVFLFQHIIIDQADTARKYRFWTHYFEEADVLDLLRPFEFENIGGFDNVLPATGIWNGDNITFYKGSKPG